MFTGIIEETGRVRMISRRGSVTALVIEASVCLEGVKIGDSVSVNGVCLTVVKKDTAALGFEVMPETWRTTNLASVRMRDAVNLERALKMGDRVSGHFVTGHIDCVGVISRKQYAPGDQAFTITVPHQFAAYLVPKGSIAVEGISLTIADKRANTFTICTIPHTLKNTTLRSKEPSDKVNVEFDILIKRG